MHRVFLRALVFILFITAGAAYGQDAAALSGQSLTLDQAIALALHNNHSVKIAVLGFGKAEDELAATRTYRRPSMQFYALFSQQLVKQDSNTNSLTDIIPGLGPFFSISAPRRPTANFGGQVLEPLSQQYRIGLNIAMARVGIEVRREEVRKREQSTVDDVKRTYYGILQTQSALDSLQEAIKLYHELDRVTGDYVAQQVSLKSDSLEVKTRLAKAEYEALDIASVLATQKDQLNHLFGRDIRTEFKVTEVPDVNGFGDDLTLVRNRALDQRPEIREARLTIKQTELDRR